MAQRLGPSSVTAILFAPLAASGRTLTDPELRGDLSGQRMPLGSRDLPVTAEGRERMLSATDAVHTTNVMKNAQVRTLACWCVSSEPCTQYSRARTWTCGERDGSAFWGLVDGADTC